MDVATLRRAMAPTGVSDATLAAYLPHFVEAMRAAGITTVRRAAAWCSQIGHESAGLRYMAEIQTSDPDWSWDRTRYRGRGPIQLTWQSNYRRFGLWCKAMGYVNDSELFVNQPELVEQPKWGFLAASWYWLLAGPRPGQINGFADQGDILAVSRCVNGWIDGQLPNGWNDNDGSRLPRWNRCLAIGDALLPSDSTTGPDPALVPEPGFAGDPWWLAAVLRAEQLTVIEMDGWQERGEGDQGVLWGAVFHHTGNVNETPEGIAFHPTLGLAAHILIRPNGDVWVCGIGKANHAGVGSWDGIVTDNANPVTIGVEVANLPPKDMPHRTGWPDIQYNATVKVFAAILRKLAQRANRAISHKEWAQLGPAGWRQGKWDPGSIDMDTFRGDVQTRIDSYTPENGDDDMFTDADRDLLKQIAEYRRKSLSPLRWPYEGAVNTCAGFAWAADGNIHVVATERLAVEYGDPTSIALLYAVSNTDEPGRDDDVKLADRILAKVSPEHLAAAQARIQQWLDAESAWQSGTK